MKILMIRHGDPDYEHDTLTKRGEIEAEALAKRLIKIPIDAFCVSPLGRAKRTAQPTLEALGAQARELPWLEEFPVRLDINHSETLQKAFPDTGRCADGTFRGRIVWDMLPGAWMRDESHFEKDAWRRMEMARVSDMEAVYDRCCAGLDALLADYGYNREGGMYTAKQGSDATIALFCHFGITAVMLSHLWNVSPFILLHSLAMAPSSVTEVNTEERIKGEVSFRTSRVGDISHLYADGIEPSFSCRFCELYENADQRH